MRSRPTDRFFQFSILSVSLAFVPYFAVVVGPPLPESGDVFGAFAAGCANPHSSGDSADAIACWILLATWVAFDARTHPVRGGWVHLGLKLLPSVVVGRTASLVLHSRRISESRRSGGA